LPFDTNDRFNISAPLFVTDKLHLVVVYRS
jgi:hypothetical protein